MAKFATWNMQGCSGDKWYVVDALFREHNLEILCLQECGIPPPTWEKQSVNSITSDCIVTQYTYKIKRSKVFDYTKLYICHCDVPVKSTTKLLDNRCNLTIFSTKKFTSPPTCKYGTTAIKRPVLIAPIIDSMGSKIYIGSVHAASPGGGDTRSLVSAMDDYVTSVDGSSNWKVFGDFNRDPDSFLPGHVPPGTVCPPNGPTQESGGRLDYAFISNGISADGKRIDIATADHTPVIFTF